MNYQRACLSLSDDSKGFSLVELMISLTLGLFLSLAAIQTYLTSIKADTIILGNTEIQENARFALQVIEKAAQQAGYFSDPNQNRRDYFLTQSKAWKDSVFQTPDSLLGFDDAEESQDHQPASANNTDQFFIRLTTDAQKSGESAPWYNCNGKQIPFQTSALMGFYISKKNALICISQIPGNHADTQALIENVEDFQILYGLDSSNDGAVNRYVTAQLVRSFGDWDSVRTLKISLTLSSSTPRLEPKKFEKTISLRNML